MITIVPTYIYKFKTTDLFYNSLVTSIYKDYYKIVVKEEFSY